MGESERTVETGIIRNEYSSTPINDRKAFLSAFKALSESPTWQELDVGLAKHILDDKPFADCEDRQTQATTEARDLLDYFRAYETARDSDQATNASECAYHVGRLARTLRVRFVEEPARLGKESLVFVRGHWIKVTPTERAILEFMGDKTEASIHEFVKACWSKRYNAEERKRYDTAISRFNDKLTDANPTAPTFSIRSKTVVVS